MSHSTRNCTIAPSVRYMGDNDWRDSIIEGDVFLMESYVFKALIRDSVSLTSKDPSPLSYVFDVVSCILEGDVAVTSLDKSDRILLCGIHWWSDVP